MKKHKWKTIAGVITAVISSVYGVNIYTNQNHDIPTIHEQISAVPITNQIILQFGETYDLEDGYQIQITIDKFNRKRVVFTPKGD